MVGRRRPPGQWNRRCRSATERCRRCCNKWPRGGRTPQSQQEPPTVARRRQPSLRQKTFESVGLNQKSFWRQAMEKPNCARIAGKPKCEPTVRSTQAIPKKAAVMQPRRVKSPHIPLRSAPVSHKQPWTRSALAQIFWSQAPGACHETGPRQR